jgi:hypothetical protein
LVISRILRILNHIGDIKPYHHYCFY